MTIIKLAPQGLFVRLWGLQIFHKIPVQPFPLETKSSWYSNETPFMVYIFVCYIESVAESRISLIG